MVGQRTCIKCNSPQEPIIILGVEIDRCVSCGGIWLDGGEIKQLVEQRTPGSDARLEATIAQLAKASPTGGAPPPSTADIVNVACPACGGKLTIAWFGDTSIEQCNRCDGIFVERGELAKAMKLVDSNEATTIMALAKSVTTSGQIDG
jgi:Zn-finger nucleic acid-binding protein